MRSRRPWPSIEKFGFSGEMVEIFRILKKFLDFVPNVKIGKFCGLYLSFRFRNRKKDTVFFENIMAATMFAEDVKTLEKMVFKTLGNGNSNPFIFDEDLGMNMRWNIPSFSTAEELRMKLELAGYGTRNNR